MIDFDACDVLSFDCYGTLIDWEAGLGTAMARLLGEAGEAVPPGQALEWFGETESAIERGPYRPYRAVLAAVAARLRERAGLEPEPEACAAFAASVADWPAFPDSGEALAALHRRYRLAVISNVDDDLFAASARRLGTTFDWVITAQQVQSYKPSENNFRQAFTRIGVPPARILHVAQSLYHDIAPARRLGLTTVWVNRRSGQHGTGATPRADAVPHLEVPDLATLARLAVR